MKNLAEVYNLSKYLPSPKEVQFAPLKEKPAIVYDLKIARERREVRKI